MEDPSDAQSLAGAAGNAEDAAAAASAPAGSAGAAAAQADDAASDDLAAAEDLEAEAAAEEDDFAQHGGGGNGGNNTADRETTADSKRSRGGSKRGGSRGGGGGGLSSSRDARSSLAQVGIALPLLMHSLTAASIISQSAINELLRSALRDASAATPGASASAAGASKDKSSSSGTHKHKESSAHSLLHGTLEEEHARLPYHLEANNNAACSLCLQHVLLPSLAHAAQLQPTPLYSYDWSVKQQALLIFARARCTRPDDAATTTAVTNAAAEGSILSQLLLEFLGQSPATAAASSASAIVAPAVAVATAAAVCDPRFLAILHRGLANVTPLSMNLSSGEEQFYAAISRLGLQALQQPPQTSSLLANAGISAGDLRETMLRYWLGRGGLQQCLDAASFLLRQSSSTGDLRLRPFMRQWSALMRASSRTVLRVSRMKHLTQVANSARTTKLVCSMPAMSRAAAAAASSGAKRNPAVPQCRRWDYEDESGWSRYDERICQILEEAYQAGLPSVDFRLDAPANAASPAGYRADFVKMTQKNLTTGRERALRCLLALQIKDKSGRVTQTVEINMPHDTLIRDLRAELANYLRHDDKLLRLTYGNRVLRRADYENATIRAGILPLGTEGLTVTRLQKGDCEDMCTFMLTEARSVKQPLFECATCDFGREDGCFMCAVCAMQCHKGHDTRRISDEASGGSVGFCCCGAGVCSDLVSCRSLEGLPDAAETYYSPHMTLSPCGSFLYVLSTEHGLMKLGTGTTAASVTGQLYAQNTQMCAHAGAQLVCVKDSGRADARSVLLMRSPVLGASVLLHIDADTLLFTDQRTMLPAVADAAPAAAVASSSAAEFPPSSCIRPRSDLSNSWQLEYQTKPPSDDPADTKADAAAAATLDENGQPIAAWTALPSALIEQAKLVLCSNWSYGTLIYPHGVYDPSLPSLLLEEEGMVLRSPIKLGVRRAKVKVKHSENIQPLFFLPATQQLQVINLVPLQPTATTATSGSVSSPPARSSRRREHGLALDLYQLPADFTAAPTPYCRRCSVRLPDRPSSPATVPLAQLPFAYACPRCDAAAFDGDEQKRESEPSAKSSKDAQLDSMYRKSSDVGPSLPPSLPASPTGTVPTPSYSAEMPTPLSAATMAGAPGASSSSSASPPARNASAEETELEEKLYLLSLLGVSRARAVAALQFAGGDLDGASNALLAEMEAVQSPGPAADDAELSGAEEELRQALAAESEAGDDAAALMQHPTASASPAPITFSPSPSPSASPIVPSFEGTAAAATAAGTALATTLPVGERFYEHALAATALGGPICVPALGSGPLMLQFLAASFVKRVHLETIVDSFNKDARLRAAMAAASGSSTSNLTLMCDGCGGCGEPVVVGDRSDASLVEAGKAASLARLFVCQDRACGDQVVLCQWCRLMGHWNSSTHRAEHQMSAASSTSRSEAALPIPSTIASALSSSTAPAPLPSNPHRLTLGEYACYLDVRRGVLVVLRDGREGALLPGPPSSTHHESCVLFDVESGSCLARKLSLETRGDCYAMDEQSHSVWAFSALSVRLERWECMEDGPDAALTVAESSKSQSETVDAVETATTILRHLPCISSSLATISSGLQQLLQLVEHVFAPSSDSLRQSESLVSTLLFQVRSHLRNWNLRTSPLYGATALSAAQLASECPSFAPTLARLKQLLQQALGLHMPSESESDRRNVRSMLQRRERERDSSSSAAARSRKSNQQHATHRTLFPSSSPADTTDDSGASTPPTMDLDASAAVMAPWPAAVQSEACGIFVEGFDLFYPSWKQRVAVLERLVDASTSVSQPIDTDEDVGIAARPPPVMPCAQLLLTAFDERYRAAYMGLKPLSSPIASVAPGAEATDDASLLSPTVQNLIHTWIELIFEHELTAAAEPAGPAPSKPHVLAHVVLSYQLHLVQLLSLQNQPESTAAAGSNGALLRQVRSANTAFMKLATEVFQHAVELLQGVEKVLQQKQPQEKSQDPTVAAMLDASLAERTMACVWQSTLGSMVQWCLLALSELQIDQLALLSSATHAQLIAQFLKQTMSLLCALSALQSRALQVSRVEQDESLDSDRATPNQTRIRLGNTRQKIAALRQSGQLLTLHSLGAIVASPPSRSSSGASASKRSSKSSAAPPLPYMLTPAATEVFTDIFFEFVSARSGYAAARAPSTSGTSHHRWNIGRASLLRADLASLYRKRGAHSTEAATTKANHAFTKYGLRSANTEMSPAAAAYGLVSGGSNQQSAVFGEGDEASALSLPAFLQLMTDACVESPRRVLRDLRVLELRHHFLQTHHPALHLLGDCKVAFSHVLHRLFSMPVDASSMGQLSMQMTASGLQYVPRSLSAAASSVPSFAQALRDRTIEELVNIPPGSKEMSESLRIASAAAQRQITLARTAAANTGGEEGDAAGRSIGQSVLMRLLASQDSWKASVGSRTKLVFMSQFVLAPLLAPPPQHLPMSSPVANLTPMLRHELAAEDLASSLVGETSTVIRHGATKLGQGMTGEFSDAAASERLSTLFQSCMRELGAGIASNFLVYPSSDPAVLSPHAATSKSLLASLSLLSGDRTPPGPSGSTNGIPASAALFLCEKLFFCALIKHNGLTDECIAYARSLELYRLLASKQTKNVRLLHQQACPEWLRKAIRATARFVRQPIMDLLRKHREAQHEEAARLKEAAAARAAAKKAGATSSSISDASGLKERKEDNESIRLTPPPSAPPTPSHGPSAPSTPAAHRKLNVTVDALDEDEKEEVESFPSVTLYQTLDRWISNCEFLLGSELRTLLLQPPVAAGASRPHSLHSSPQRGLRSPVLTPQGSPGSLTSASRTMSEFVAKGTTEAAGSELLFPHRNQAAADDADEDEEDEEMYRKQAEQEDGSGGLLLRRVQSDLFASPMRAAVSGSMAQISNLDLGASSSTPAASTPHQTRRLSDSDVTVPQIAIGVSGPGELDRPGTANTDASALSSWTSTTVRAAASSPPVEGDEEESSAAQRSFESDWLARLMTHDQRLSDSIGFSVRFLTSSLTNRIKLLQLINSAFQAGHTQQIVDDLLPLVWNARILKDIHSSNSLRSSNHGDALLFFYQHLSQTLGKINLEPEAEQQGATTMTSLSLGQASAPTSGALSSSQRQHLRLLYSRIETILRYFSLDASQTDSDIILGSGMLTVLPRFIARLDHAQGDHQRSLHAQLYHPFVTPLMSAPTSLSSSAEDLRALKDAVSRSTSGNANIVLASTAPAAALVSPPASSLWLWDEAVRLSSSSQRWSWHIFCYLSSFLLGQPLSRHTAQQRYVLASTVSRQLNAMVQDHIQRIQQAIVSGFTFTSEVDTDSPPLMNDPTVRSTAGRVRATDMPELGVFPLQVGNPLRVGGQLLDELVFRAVDMLKLLERVAAGPASQQQQAHTQRSAQEHSVCSRKHILFFLRVLRTDQVEPDAGDSTKPPSDPARPHVPVALPSIIQLAIIQLLKRELPYHAPLLQPSLSQPPSASPSAPSSTLNSPARKAPPNPHSTLFMPSFSPPLSSPPPPFSAALLRTPSTLAEDAAFSDVDLARELLATVAAMQSQQSLLNLDMWQQQREEERSAVRGQQDYKESESKQQSPPPSMAREKSSDFAGDASTSVAASSSSATVLSPLSAKEQARQASFRRIATLVCPSCSYIEFPACAKHRTFLTRQLASGAAACPDESCSTATAAGSQWARCLSCKKPRSSTTGSVIGLSWWLISAAEASYASTASKSNSTAIIPHNVFTCPVCCVAEFPGTRTGGLTLNMNGRLYDAPTRKYLDIEQYQFTHFSPACKGQMQFTPVRLAKEEAAYLGRFIQRTPPIDPKLPLSDFGPGKGSTFPKAASNAGSGANVSPSGSLAGHTSSASMLASLLGEPQAYMHWTPTEQGRACALMEMVNLLRSFLGTAARDTTVARDPTASKDREAEPASSFTMRAVSSVDMQSQAPSTSLKTQWRESLLPMLRSSFYDSASAIADLTATTSAGSSSSSFAASAPRVLRSMLALLVLGGLPEIITNGSKVQVMVDGSLLTGIVQHFDPLLATVSVAVKRHAADTNSSDSNKDAASANGTSTTGPRTGQDVASIIRQLGLQSDQQSFSAGVLEFRVDQVTPISPSPPPPLSVLGSVADILQQAQQLLSIDPTPPQTRPLTPEDEERKEMMHAAPPASPAAIAMRQGMLGLLVAQLQQQLLLLLHLHLPSWLHSASPLSSDVLQLLSVSLSRWQSSAMASSIPLHSHEWATTARVLSQQLVEQVGRMQDPFLDRRVPLGQTEMPHVEPTASAASLSRTSSTHAATSAASSAEIGSHISSPRQLMFPSLNSGHGVRVTTGGSHLPLARSNAFSLLDRQESSDDESLESPSAVNVPILAAPPPVPLMLQNLDRLSSMGFPPVACRFALATTRGNLEASISLILEQLGQAEEMEVDEAQANVAFEATIDRLGQRAAVEAHRAYQEAQQAQQAARQASAVVDASAPIAPPMTMPASASYPGSGASASAMSRQSSGVKSLSEPERRLVQAAPHIHMTSRYAWSEEVPLDALALAAPVDSAVAASRALNTGTAARPIDWSIEQDKAHLLARARLGTLLGAELVIPPDAVESLSRSASGAGPRKGYKIGDTLTIIDLVNKVCPAVVDDVNEDGSKIYLHYLGWSKKWDEWVAVDSKRIQPKFSVGEKLTVKDTCQKDSEAQVLEVAIKDNQLKIFIHYISWSEKWREWIPANSNRIVARHKDRNEGAANSFASLQAALGLSSAGLASAPFALDNRTGEVLAVDWSTSTASSAVASSSSSSASADNDPGPTVLLRVVDETQLHCTILIWVRLALLRSSTPRAHQTPTHLCPLPPKPSGFNAASIAALRLDTQGLMQMTIGAQQNACACLAKRIVQESLTRITHAPKPATAAEQAAAIPMQVLSPISPLSPMLLHSPADVQPALLRVLHQFKLPHLLPLFAHQSPSQQVSILNFAQPDLGVSASASTDSSNSAEKKDHRARTVATVAQLILARWQMDAIDAEAEHPDGDDEVHEHAQLAFSSFEAEMLELIESAKESLLRSTQSLPMHKLTTVTQGQSLTVAMEMQSRDRHQRHAADRDYEDEEAPSDEESAHEDPVPFQLQLVSCVLPVFPASQLNPRFSKEAVWSIRFYADAAHTILLRELSISSDPHSRQIAPFVVTNPVFISSSLSHKSAEKLALAKDKLASKSGSSLSSAAATALKAIAADDQATFSITPFEHEGMETMLLLAEAISHVRRLQIAGVWAAKQGVMPAQPSLSANRAFNFGGAASSSSSASATTSTAFFHTVSRSASLARQCDSFLVELFDAFRDFLEQLQLVMPLVSNMRVRAMEAMTTIMQTSMLSSKSMRDEQGVLLKPDVHRRSAEDTDDDSLNLSDSSSQRPHGLDISWVAALILPEAKARYAAEKPSYPIFSVYLQRMLELMLVAMRYERSQAEHAAIDAESKGRMQELPLLRALKADLPILLDLDELLLHATHPDAHAPIEDTGVDVEECSCVWCEDLQDRRDESQQAAMMLDLAPSSVVGTIIADDDHFPTIRESATDDADVFPRARAAKNAQGLASLSLVPDTPARSQAAASSISSILSSFNSRLFRRAADAAATGDVAAASSLAATSSSSSSSLAEASSSSTALVPAASGWRSQVSVCDRLLSSPSLRARLLNHLLNGSSAPSLSRPEIAFKRSVELDEMTSITASKHLYRSRPHVHALSPSGSATADKDKNGRKSASAEVDSLGRSGMFQQLVDAFIKANLHCRSISLRAEMGAVTFKCILSGVLDAGAAGLPGPFRQALAEISAALAEESMESSGTESAAMSLLIPSPNSRSQTGDDRNKMVLNPALLSRGEISLVQCRILGQLLGVAIRSKCCLNLDLSSVVWKGLLEVPLVEEDLASFDFTASRSLKFVDPSSDLPFTAEEFDEYLGYLTWTTVLSDGVTMVELKPGGAHTKVHFAQRSLYAQKAIEARLQESSLLVSCIREGLLSVIPKQSLHFLSWRELELRVCGRPTVDLAVLEKHTVYSSGYTRASPIIQNFWQVLREFTPKELGEFLQFSWARSRLPADEAGQGSYRMQLNILDAAPKASAASPNNSATPPAKDPNDMLLPTSETCFFNVNMPKYSNLETMRAKIKMALLCSTITS